ncbi:MAG TPA: diacylglycerol kinase family protein [Gaiellaceae bacterium]|nr:diacylglycerol kinase family protein [Gaiellaceae bacterium]
MPEGGVVFVVNPASANGSTRRLWPELAHRAAELGLVGEAVFSERPGHAAELAATAAADGAELVVAVGGDGTVNEVANGLLAAPEDGAPELAVLPRGTGTDFVRHFGISGKLEGAVAAALSGSTRTIDAGRIRYRAWSGENVTAHFVNAASAGMSGAVAQRANTSSKALGGKASFLWATLAVFARWHASEMEVIVDSERRSGLLYDAIVANCRYLGGGMAMCPDAEPDDGLLDVLVIGDITRRDLALTLPKVYRGTHLPHPKAEALRGARVFVDAATPIPVELDGEQPGTTPAIFEIVPGALRLRVPAS